ncbi:hypothetical protein DFJ43DRAFT_107338 [Lentinula guzmanii]|uniref:Uncharacterized protein n=1 Tax=Lentinula guzmanii TaxID=2804957 RepID=A0AA38JQW0_9AGAR|nr:hypothetical protein DFJ43DRAFT_107338 [Lentinula guzmanii]
MSEKKTGLCIWVSVRYMSIIVTRKVFVIIHFGNMWTKSSKISRNRSRGRYPSRSRIFWKPTLIHTAMSIWRGCLMRTNFHGLFTSIPRPSFIFASCPFSYAPIYFSLMLLYYLYSFLLVIHL